MSVQEKIDALRSASHRQTSVVASVITMLSGFIQQVRDAKDDPDEIEQITNEIEASTGALAQAVASNTPASLEVPEADGGTGTDSTVVDASQPEMVGEGSGETNEAVEGDAIGGEETEIEADGQTEEPAADTSSESGSADEGDGASST